MSGHAILRQLIDRAIVPAIRTPSAEMARRASDALAAGGLTQFEIALTVPGALELIRGLRQEYGHWLIGAGTVLDEATARTAILAGAQFVVTPTLNIGVISCCRRYSIPVLAGALTPTEILNAWEAGADIVKVFPCSALGGAGYVRALRAPLPQVRLMPMGGITVENAAAYLEAGADALGVGSDLVIVAALAKGEDSLVTRQARHYLEAVQAYRSRQ